MEKVKFYFEEEKVKPYKKHHNDAGWDLKSKTDTILYPGETKIIPTGVTTEIPKGYVGIVKPRSSWGAKGIDVTAGVIDSDYRGEIGVVIQNHADKPLAITKGERIAQILVVPVLLEAEFEEGKAPKNTARGAGGFGSTGK
ncbi:dUTP diphosphatase [Pseudothermotoga sp.]|uniref:dUTP diphosphatase n=1 Tax=Pseudothermotoga sp. TaxID=2033661 RepID=UPI000E82A865|nr:dUTP diphosphatase [Pseudothermotoga sp.]HBJ81586.1 dUTP diphosphatase [Pseudothermotoga sp.]